MTTQDPSQPTTCKKCGIYIEFIKTKKGKYMPVEPKIVTIIDDEGNIHKGYIPHWAVCSDADYFRKK